MKGVHRGIEVTAAQAAVQLRLSRERVIRLIQTGALPGRRDPARGWLVEVKAVEQQQSNAAA